MRKDDHRPQHLLLHHWCLVPCLTCQCCQLLVRARDALPFKAGGGEDVGAAPGSPHGRPGTGSKEAGEHSVLFVHCV